MLVRKRDKLKTWLGKQLKSKKTYNFMLKKEDLFFCVAVILIFLIAPIVYSAVGEPAGEFETNYSLGEKIKGWTNLSFTDEPADNLFSDIFNNKIKLIDVLKKSNYEYTCLPASCEAGYSLVGNEVVEKTISVSSSGEEYAGIKIQGSDVYIEGVVFSVSSNSVASCTNPLSLDILDNGEINFENPKYTNDNCGGALKSSCSGSFGTDWASIDNQDFYCEQINLPKSPAFEVKAKIKYSGTEFSAEDLKAYIWDGEFVGDCNLPKPTSAGGEVSCVIPYLNKEAGNKYVCVKKEVAGSGYQINYKNSGDFCGLSGVPSSSSKHVAEYNIVANAKKYAALGSFVINEKNYSKYNNGDSIVQSLDNYISDQYDRDCSDGCIIPIKVSGIPQEVTLKSLSITYTSEAAPAGTSQTKSGEVKKAGAKVTADFQKVDLNDLGFKLPNQPGTKDYEISFSGEKIIESEINISNVQKIKILQLYPTKIAVAQSTGISVFISSDSNVTGASYVWDFGDATNPITTNEKKVFHTYNSLGNYTITIKINVKGKEVTKEEFEINAISPKDAINETITYYNEKIKEIEEQTSDFPQDYKTILREHFDLQILKTTLASYDSDYKKLLLKSDAKDEEYIVLMKKLSELKIPISINPIKESNIIFINNPSDINLDDVTNLYFNEDPVPGYDEKYIEAINKWYLENLNVKINHKIIAIYYAQSSQPDPFVSEFKIDITPKSSLGYEGYLIIDEDSEKLMFDKNYDLEESIGVTGLTVNFDSPSSVAFAVEGGVDVFELPYYILPPINKLSVNTFSGGGGVEKPQGFRWMFFIISILILLIVAFAVYVFLQKWYKHNYESYLFKNKNELYNLMNFIYNARRQRMPDKEIINKLKASRWKGEQINYVMDKLNGRNTGMWEIPFFKFFRKKKMERKMRNMPPRQAGFGSR